MKILKTDKCLSESSHWVKLELRYDLHNLSGCFLWKNEDKKMPKDNKLCYS